MNKNSGNSNSPIDNSYLNLSENLGSPSQSFNDSYYHFFSTNEGNSILITKVLITFISDFLTLSIKKPHENIDSPEITPNGNSGDLNNLMNVSELLPSIQDLENQYESCPTHDYMREVDSTHDSFMRDHLLSTNEKYSYSNYIIANSGLAQSNLELENSNSFPFAFGEGSATSYHPFLRDELEPHFKKITISCEPQ